MTAVPPSRPAAPPPGYRAMRAGFSIGDTLQDTFDAVFKNFGVFVVLALVLYGAPTFLAALLVHPLGVETLGPGTAGVRALVQLVGLVANVVLEGALARAVFDHLNGRRPSAGVALRAALDSILPLVGIAILSVIGIVIGFVFLIVPGFVLLTLWSVVAPAQVVERRGVFASFGRSGELTAGHRWAVFFLLVIVWILTLVIGAIGAAVVGVAGAGAAAAAGATGFGPVLIVGGAIQALAGSLGAVFTGAAGAAIYYELRRAKEGLAAADLGRVFD